MKTLNLVLKHKWYDMIASGKKKEEYREIKPYWVKRLVSDYTHVRFSRGYSAKTMTFTIEDIDIGRGRPEWGAPDCTVFIIKLGQQVPDKNPEKQG